MSATVERAPATTGATGSARRLRIAVLYTPLTTAGGA